MSGSDRMRDLVASLPRQMETSGDLEGLAELQKPSRPPSRLVLCGMGGSAIAGDLLQPLLEGCQIVVRRDYGLPAWTGPDDLVLAASYSGNTAETLAGWDEAGRRGCDRLALTSGGELAVRAAEAGVPRVTLPPALPPRAALGHAVGALVHMLARYGCLTDAAGHIAAAVAELDRLGDGRLDTGVDEEDGAGNPHPRRVARDLLRSVAVIHTAGDEAHAGGLRLKAQLNENAKVPAQVAAYPELDHNELVGWGAADTLPGDFTLIRLQSPDLAASMARRVTVTENLLVEAFGARHAVLGTGTGPLARIMALVQWGDALSWHLADLRGVDPVTVNRIEDLKRALAAGPDAPTGENP